jgi:hypothetical protein
MKLPLSSRNGPYRARFVAKPNDCNDCNSASRHAAIDPRVTREEVSARLLGHRTNLAKGCLAAKADGESSMFGKPGHVEAVKT